jgi:hypothetical protein
MDNQCGCRSQAPRRGGGGEAPAEQLLGERENDRGQARFGALPASAEGSQPLTDWIKRALTRRTTDKTVTQVESDVEPSDRLVLGVKFAIAFTFSLTALEIAHLALLRTWNSEVFAAITGLAGTITGILISQKAGE